MKGEDINMTGGIEWTPLHIADAGRMAATGRFGPSEKAARDRIRKLVKPEIRQTFAFSGGSSEEDAPNCAAILTIADGESRRGILRLLMPVGTGTSELAAFLTSFCSMAFFRLGLHRVEMAIEAGEEAMMLAARAAGMQEEGRLQNAVFSDGLHMDAFSFSLLRPQNGKIAYGFVPFAKGLVAIRGTAVSIDRVQFEHYGETPEDPFLCECAAYRGYMHKGGVLGPQERQPVNAEAPPLPAEVSRACIQVAEYFAHRRSHFDLNLEYPQRTSDFQRNVWKILSGIGYGHLWTYEDVAVAVVNGSREEARKMARAVGTACASNPIALIIPCHRVIGKDGKLTGFSGGVDIKEFLLAHEWIRPQVDNTENRKIP